MPSRRKFLKSSAQTAAALAVANTALQAAPKPPAVPAAGATTGLENSRPNIILFLVDDMGYSDIGCFGSEIATPNLDALAASGLRMSQWYNNPRCCPSRASIMTGLYSHQVGFGMMADDAGHYPYPSYRGDLSAQCVTMPEVLKTAGYSTAMAGKWHLAAVEGNIPNPKHNWPMQRGFERYYGTIIGAGSYYNPNYLVRDNDRIEVPKDPEYYYTDAIAEKASGYVAEMAKKDAPFFLYCAFTAPHWPLQAPEDLVAKYADRYAGGWDDLRAERNRKQVAMGLLRPEWKVSARDPRVPAWENAQDKTWEQRRMAVYAAMIERMDAGVGRIVKALEASGKVENTLIVFMSDNGGNAEELGANHPPKWRRPNYIPYTTKDGKRDVVAGNRPDVYPGHEDTYQSVGIPWGNVANTPFRLYKHYTQEGGISSPFIAHWPKGIQPKGKITDSWGHETDLMATFLAVSGAKYPASVAAGPSPPYVGASLTPLFAGQERNRNAGYWAHAGNKAVRDGKYKAVCRFPIAWELYDLDADRTELNDLSKTEPDRLATMIRMWQDWERMVGAQPWPLPSTPKGESTGVMDTPAYLKNF